MHKYKPYFSYKFQIKTTNYFYNKCLNLCCIYYKENKVVVPLRTATV